MSFGEREVEGVLVVGCTRLDVRSLRNEEPGHFDVARERGRMQSGPATFLAGVYVGAMLQQRANRCQVAGSSGGVQGHVVSAVSRARVDIGAALEQGFHKGRAGEESGQVERGPTVVAVACYLSGVRIDQLQHAIFKAGYAGGEEIQLDVLFKQQRSGVVTMRVFRGNEWTVAFFVLGDDQGGIGGQHGAYFVAVAGTDGVEKGFTHWLMAPLMVYALGWNIVSALETSQSRWLM